jgi:ATP-dependent helicase/nuclease subunit B
MAQRRCPSDAVELGPRSCAAGGRATEPLAGALVRHHRSGRGLTTRFTLSTGRSAPVARSGGVGHRREGGLSGLWSGEAGDTLATLLGEVIETEGQIEADGPQWIDIMGLVCRPGGQAACAQPSPLFIFGTLEARLQSVDTLILGGLNEGSWPGQTANNPFMSRTMKTRSGWSRRSGGSASWRMISRWPERHAHLVYTRALRKGATPTVASRWLQRLLAFGGKPFEATLRDRGRAFQHWAGCSIRASAGAGQAAEPNAAARSAAEILFLQRGRPAAARSLCDLCAARPAARAVDPFNRDPGAAERGTLYHTIIDRFVREGNMPASPDARWRWSGFSPSCSTWNRPCRPISTPSGGRAFRSGAPSSIGKAERRPGRFIRKRLTEVRGASFSWSVDIKLSGVADRIDITGPAAPSHRLQDRLQSLAGPGSRAARSAAGTGSGSAQGRWLPGCRGKHVPQDLLYVGCARRAGFRSIPSTTSIPRAATRRSRHRSC